MGEPSFCAGKLEMRNQGEWRPVVDWDFTWEDISAAAVCRRLGCGTAVSANMMDESVDRRVWWIKSSCIQSASTLQECVTLTGYGESYWSLEVVCSGKSELVTHLATVQLTHSVPVGSLFSCA